MKIYLINLIKYSLIQINVLEFPYEQKKDFDNIRNHIICGVSSLYFP